MTPVKEVVFERTFDAPLATVWQAWTDPKMIKQWWGPQGVVIPECEIELQVGGKVYIVMEAGEAMGPYKGTRWPMQGKFTVVEPNSKLAFTTRAWTEGQETMTIDQLNELVLTEENGKTKMTLKVTVTELGPGTEAAMQGMQAGFNQQFDKLGALLAHA